MQWHQFDRGLRRQARELRERLGVDGDLEDGNGHSRGRAVEEFRRARRRRRRRCLVAIGLLLATLGMIERGCVVFQTSQARLEAAEAIIREEAIEKNWSDERLDAMLESLRRRYRSDR